MSDSLAALTRFMSLERLTLLFLFVLYLPVSSLLDPDYYWHLETGEYIVRNNALPHVDIFSYTKLGEPWTLHEWLFQVSLYSVYTLAGETGVKIITLLAVLVSVNIAASSASRITRKPAVTAFLIAAAFLSLVPFLAPRPQLVTFVFFATYLSAILKWKYEASDRLLWALPVLMIIWVNCHGAFAIGIGLLVLATVFEFAHFRWQATHDEARGRRIRRLAIIALLTLGASSINPYFVGQWLYPIQVSLMDASKLISEWKSPTFHSSMGIIYLCFVVSFFLVQIYRDRRPDMIEIGVPLFFVILGFIAMRHISLATLAMLPFFVLAAGDGVSGRFADLTDRLRPRRMRASTESQQMKPSTIYSIHWVLAGMIIAFGYVTYPARASETERKTRDLLPVDAVQFVIDANLRGRMFNAYGYGGYLIHRFYPDRLVFIDGRVDVYGDRFFSDYLKVLWGQPGWYEVIQEHKVDYVIAKKKAATTQLFIAQGDFILVYEDERDAVLVRDIPKFHQVIRDYLPIGTVIDEDGLGQDDGGSRPKPNRDELSESG